MAPIIHPERQPISLLTLPVTAGRGEYSHAPIGILRNTSTSLRISQALWPIRANAPEVAARFLDPSETVVPWPTQGGWPSNYGKSWVNGSPSWFFSNGLSWIALPSVAPWGGQSQAGAFVRAEMLHFSVCWNDPTSFAGCGFSLRCGSRSKLQIQSSSVGALRSGTARCARAGRFWTK
jgi:hypothetical protein